MAIITSINRNSLILANIQATLQQIKVQGVPNQRLALGEPISGLGLYELTLDQLYSLTLADLASLQLGTLTCTVDFYVDEAKTNLLFTENTVENPSDFSIINNKLFYTPPDSLINCAADTDISNTLNQYIYYVTVAYSDGTIFDLIYKNVNNLLFQQVIVASKVEPTYAGNGNVGVLTVNPEAQFGTKNSDDRRWNLPSYDLTVFINILDWQNLSELDRISAYQNNSNIIMNALMKDRYRAGNSALHDKDLDGTAVFSMKPLPSKDRMKGILKINCAYFSIPGNN